MTTFELPGCVDMWTVLSGDQVIDLVSMDYDDDTTRYNIQHERGHEKGHEKGLFQTTLYN